MMDKLIENLEYDGISFCGEAAIDFFGGTEKVDIMFNSEEGDSVKEVQYEAYNALLDAMSELEKEIAEKIVEFYNDGEKGSYGPDDEEEFNEWWPNIDEIEDLIPLLHMESIIIPDEDMMEFFGGRTVYILFNRDWGGEDYDDLGVAVKIVNETVEEVGYKDIAY